MASHERGLTTFTKQLRTLHINDLFPYFASQWDKHCEYEFATRELEVTMTTMVGEPYVNHIPIMTGGVGQIHLKRSYQHHFIPKTPKDTMLIPVSRTVGEGILVDEMVFCFTHDIEIDWMLPNIQPTGRELKSHW